MFNQPCFVGDIPDMVLNRGDCYEGDMQYYFVKVLEAPNVHKGYHGLRHMLHVPWYAYQACRYYIGLRQIDRRRARNTIIAGFYHDIGHPGYREDLRNLEVAFDFLHRHILPEDRPYLPDIISIMGATHHPYPPLGKGEKLTLEQQIIRDADMSQAFGTTWIGDIIGGLGQELGKSPIEMLEMQIEHLRGIRFYSEFGQKYFGQPAIDAKIKEVQALLRPVALYRS